jgi:hypothetical protein
LVDEGRRRGWGWVGGEKRESAREEASWLKRTGRGLGLRKEQEQRGKWTGFRSRMLIKI